MKKTTPPLFLKGVAYCGVAPRRDPNKKKDYSSVIFNIKKYDESIGELRKQLRSQLYNHIDVKMSEDEYDPSSFRGLGLKLSHSGPLVGTVHSSNMDSDRNILIFAEVTNEEAKEKIRNGSISSFSIGFDRIVNRSETKCALDHIALVEKPFQPQAKISCMYAEDEYSNGHGNTLLYQ